MVFAIIIIIIIRNKVIIGTCKSKWLLNLDSYDIPYIIHTKRDIYVYEGQGDK